MFQENLIAIREFILFVPWETLDKHRDMLNKGETGAAQEMVRYTIEATLSKWEKKVFQNYTGKTLNVINHLQKTGLSFSDCVMDITETDRIYEYYMGKPLHQ